MNTFSASCTQCGHQFVLPPSKQGAYVNCPRCEQLQSVGRAADVAWFWGLTLGVYGVLAFICLTAAVIGVTQQMPALWISTAAIWVVLTIALLIFIASS